MKRSYGCTTEKGREEFVKRLTNHFLDGEGIKIRQKTTVPILSIEVKGMATLCVTKGSLLEILCWENPRAIKKFRIEIET